jgi:hypothetical protein
VAARAVARPADPVRRLSAAFNRRSGNSHVAGKIALEEHFNLAEFSNELPQYVNAETMREISGRLLDVTTMRLADMDAAGIATHALRLMTSGLFDRFPRLTVILGHLGETLPFNIWRISHTA